jgi:hypothetical protein
VWLSKCWTIGKTDSLSWPSLCSCHLNSGLLQISWLLTEKKSS